MVYGKNLHVGRIGWKTIGEDDFNRAVEVLLLKMFDRHPLKAAVINGRGGDEGIDVAVWDGDTVTKIFQLKYYPEGFTGGFRDARRPQVKKSFDTAWRKHHPKEWVLIMPPNPHINEKRFVDELAAGKPVTVDIWGQAKLDAAFADYPAVERAVLRNELVDVLKEFGSEKAVMVGANDLEARLKSLSETANSRSEYWDTEFSVQGGVVSEEYVAKHPDAMLVEPIETKITFRFGEEDRSIADQLRHSLEYGSFEVLELPARSTTFTRTGPSWVRPLPTSGSSSVQMVPRPDIPRNPELVTLNFIDENGYSQGRFEGKIAARAEGSIGISVKALFANLVTLILEFPKRNLQAGNRINVALM